MFTGIIEITGMISQTRPVPTGRKLAIRVDADWSDLALGASVAVSGVCLTIAAAHDRTLEFDVIHETLERTTLGNLVVGDSVNLERSLRIGDRLDGHFVQGHVEGTARVTNIIASVREWVVWLCANEMLRPCIIPKGGIALDGVSLTIAAVRDDEFSVALIPTTLQRTTLQHLRVGNHANIETDIITRTIVHRLGGLLSAPCLSVERLREVGFP